jgi:hypothetical protein
MQLTLKPCISSCCCCNKSIHKRVLECHSVHTCAGQDQIFDDFIDQPLRILVQGHGVVGRDEERLGNKVP